MNSLAIDVGNTQVVIGLFKKGVLGETWRLESEASRSVDEYAISVLALLGQVKVKPESIKRVTLSCVVPALQRVFSKLSEKYLGVPALVVGQNLQVPIEVRVDDPLSVGADRLVNAFSAKVFHDVPAIVVDFGTATTFDVVEEDGAYVGGVIAPGLLSAAEALSRKAALLPSIEIEATKSIVGLNTHDSMQSGLVNGYASLVDGLIEKISRERSSDYKVIATGGLARMMMSYCERLETLATDLTLQGLERLGSESKHSGV